jgi:hypothetical protein
MIGRLLERAEARTAAAMEELVATDGFGVLLARTAENAASLSRIGSETLDLALRNLRIAGRRDVARLGSALARSEDKLERVLQEVEELRDELARNGAPPPAATPGPGPPGGGTPWA